MPRKPAPLSCEFILLGLIRQEATHPYDLHKKVSENKSLSSLWKFNQPHIYIQLEKLEKGGLIQAEIRGGAAFPFRKVYAITEKGETLFWDWCTCPVEHTNAFRTEFITKLYFLKMEAPKKYRCLLEKQKETCQAWVSHLQAQRTASSDNNFQQLLLEFRIINTAAMIEFLDYCLMNIN